MSDGAQTKEHAILLKALGVSQIIVVVNKMDSISPPWGQDRYSQIECELRDLLEELQFRPRAVRFVPMSGLTGENLVALRYAICWFFVFILLRYINIPTATPQNPWFKTLPFSPSTSENCALRQWYTGPTLLEALDSFKEPIRRVDAPLRAVITSVVSENTKG
jgi:elongation factor 1 alpha-like protein